MRTPFIVRLGRSFDARSWQLVGLFAAFALVAVPVAWLLPAAWLAKALRNWLWLVPAFALLACAWMMRVLLLR